MKNFIKITLVAMLGLVAVACGTVGVQPVAVVALPTHVVPVVSGPDGTALHPFSFGHTARGGLDITLSQPTAFKPSAEASGTTAGHDAVKLTVTITNHASVAVDNSSGVWLSATADETGADQIFDTGTGDTSTVLPGHTLKYVVAFDVPKNAKTLNVDVSMSVDPPNTVDTYFSGRA